VRKAGDGKTHAIDLRHRAGHNVYGTIVVQTADTQTRVVLLNHSGSSSEPIRMMAVLGLLCKVIVLGSYWDTRPSMAIPEQRGDHMTSTGRLRLQRKIEKLKLNLIDLGTKVEERVELAVKAVKLKDASLATSVIDGDLEIDRMEIDMEEACLETLALHQPVAVDLRFITGVLKMNSQLERIGDLAVNIAETAVFLASEAPLPVPDEYYEMARKVQVMLKQALDAFVNMSHSAACQVLAADDAVDMMKHRLHRNLEERLKEDLDRRRALIHLFLVSRHLERIADHSTNIAEDVIYMATGEIVRHGCAPVQSPTEF
jgi:phosphate transport system protein